MRKARIATPITVDVVEGVEGVCLYIADQRMAGPKPWGGGNLIHHFEVDATELMDRLFEVEQGE